MCSAWIASNTQEATKKHLDERLLSIDEIERAIGEKISAADYGVLTRYLAA